ncbi:MAG: hypothetical protein K5846_01375 [Bacteroidales bacterium]|nr:hypothetical protein [Bacteroidales bacterium]
MRQTRYFAIALLLAVIVTACKPEKDSLDGTWLWTSTSGGIAGVYYTPESEAFDAKLVFKGGRFSFYKDGRKVTSGIYQTVCDIDETIYTNSGNEDGVYQAWFSLHIPEAQCQKIAEATNGIIAPSPSSAATIRVDEAKGRSLSLCDNCYDGFCLYFVEK